MKRRQAHRWGRTWIWGYRRGEWWIGARDDFACDAVVFGVFGLTLMVGRSELAGHRTEVSTR